MAIDNRARVLRERLAVGRLLIVPGAFNALSALMIEQAGFEAVYATGAGISNSYLGVPDLGLLSVSELAGHVRAMTAVTTVPLLVDIDTGFGGVHNVARTIREIEMAGGAAVQIEDQVFPKRCGHFSGKQMVPAEEMIAKIIAAGEARNTDLVIIARTDAIAVEGFEAAVERGRLYMEAGADMIFVEALETEEQIRAAAAAIEAPKLINLVEGGRTPFLPIEELEALGYAMAAFGNFALRAAMKALRDLLARLRAAGTSAALIAEILSWEERQQTVGLEQFDERETRLRELAEDIARARSSSLRAES